MSDPFAHVARKRLSNLRALYADRRPRAWAAAQAALASSPASV